MKNSQSQKIWKLNQLFLLFMGFSLPIFCDIIILNMYTVGKTYFSYFKNRSKNKNRFKIVRLTLALVPQPLRKQFFQNNSEIIGYFGNFKTDL